MQVSIQSGEKRAQYFSVPSQRAQHTTQKLPISSVYFEKLLNELEKQLTKARCDQTHRFTKSFLLRTRVENAEQVLDWLLSHDGCCDCQVLANVED